MDNYKTYKSIGNRIYYMVIIAVIAVFIIMYNVNVETSGRGYDELEELFNDDDIDYNTKVEYLNYPQETTIEYAQDYEYNTFYEEHVEMPNKIIQLAKIIEEFSKEEIFKAPVITHNKIFDTVLGIFTVPVNIIWSLAKLITKALKITGAYADYEGSISTIEAIFIRGKSDFNYGTSYGGGGGGGRYR